MTTNEIRAKFLDFFKEKGHSVIPSASLIPENDPTVLFTTAGMHPLVPYLLGEKHPAGTRLADVQKCVRTGDIDEVGDNRHLTFFEMLGNWSLGDYFKRESITWSFEFLTSPRWLNLDPGRIYVTVFEGDADAPRRPRVRGRGEAEAQRAYASGLADLSRVLDAEHALYVQETALVRARQQVARSTAMLVSLAARADLVGLSLPPAPKGQP